MCFVLFVMSQAPGIRVLLTGQNHPATDTPVIVKNEGSFPRKLSISTKPSVGRCAGITSRKQQPFWLQCCRARASRIRGPEIPTLLPLGEAAFHCLQRACGGSSMARL